MEQFVDKEEYKAIIHITFAIWGKSKIYSCLVFKKMMSMLTPRG